METTGKSALPPPLTSGEAQFAGRLRGDRRGHSGVRHRVGRRGRGRLRTPQRAVGAAGQDRDWHELPLSLCMRERGRERDSGGWRETEREQDRERDKGKTGEKEGDGEREGGE